MRPRPRRISAEQAKRKEKAESEGRQFKPRKKPEKAKPEAKDQLNFTDAESRIMEDPDDAFIQGYNAQAAVDAETHVIVAATLTNQAADTPHMAEMVEQVQENTGTTPAEISADAGYWSDDNLAVLGQKGIEAFIPPEKVKHSQWREQAVVDEAVPIDGTAKELMRHKLRTERGRARYSIEDVLGGTGLWHIKEAMRFRQLLLRSEAKARSMWRMQCAAFNLMKMYWQRQQHRGVMAVG